MSHQQPEDIQPRPRRLYPWNPIDHFRLIYWVLLKPRLLDLYRDSYPGNDEYRVGKWLQSTIIWLPIYLVTQAGALGFLPALESSVFSQRSYLWISISVVTAWLLWAMASKSEQPIGCGLILGIMVAIVAAVSVGALFANSYVTIACPTLCASCIAPILSTERLKFHGVAQPDEMNPTVIITCTASLIAGSAMYLSLEKASFFVAGLACLGAFGATFAVSSGLLHWVNEAFTIRSHEYELSVGLSAFLTTLTVGAYLLLVVFSYFDGSLAAMARMDLANR